MTLIENAQKIYIGETPVLVVYAGDAQVWPSTFLPSQISGLRGWWDAADITTLVYSSGTEVSAWLDKSDTDYDFVQATINNQPTWQAAMQNGLGRLYYTQPDVLDCSFPRGPLASYPYTFYAVVHRMKASYAAVLCSTNYAGRDHWQSDTVNTNYSTLGPPLAWSTSLETDAVSVYAFRYNTNGVARMNGVQVASANIGNAGGNNSALQLGWRTGPQIGEASWRHLIFSFNELIVYNGAHDTETLQKVERYLLDKWIPRPKQVSGLAAWWDASDVSTFTYSQPTVVSQWNDKSGKGRHVSQPEVSLQPNHISEYNGLPALWIGSGRRLDRNGDTGINVGALTVFIVWQETGDSSYGAILDLWSTVTGDDNNTGSVLFQTSTPQAQQFYVGRNNGGAGTGTAGLAPFGLYRYVGEPDGTNTAAQDGQESSGGAASSPLPFTTANGGIYIADRRYQAAHANSGYTGSLAEVIIYEKVLTKEEIKIIEEYLQAKWATPALKTFDPSTIPGLTSWYDSSDATKFTYSSGTVISGWGNKVVPSIGSVTQSIISNQPSHNTIQNGLSTVAFNRHFLNDLSGGGAYSFLHDGSNYAVFFAVKINANASVPAAIMGTSTLPGGGPLGWNHYGATTDRKMGHRVSDVAIGGGTGCSNSLTDVWTEGVWFVYSVLADPDLSTVADRSDARMNGGPSSKNNIQVGQISGGPSQYGLTFGTRAPNDMSGTWLVGEIAEVLIYNATITAQQRTDIENYLRTKWGTA